MRHPSALVGAELRGQGGHGMRRPPAYAAQAKAGKVNGRIAPEMNRIKPGTVTIDAGFGFAFPALEMAIEALAEMELLAAGLTDANYGHEQTSFFDDKGRRPAPDNC